MILRLLVLLLLLLGTTPLGNEAAAQLPIRDKTEVQAAPGFFARTLVQVRQQQAKLQRRLAAIVKEVKNGGGLEPVLLLMGLSFLYGVFHAAGPGHGKIVISSYLLTHDSRVRTGLLISFAAALVQALSAILLVGGLAIALALPRLEVTGHVRTLELVSYALIVGLGLWMLYGAVTGRGCGHAHGHDHDHEHDRQDRLGNTDGASRNAWQDHSAPPAPAASTGLARRIGRVPGLVLAVGIRPCSGAVIVLLFTLANDLLAVGVAATLVMALGTGLTVSVLGTISVFGNRLATLLGTTRHSRWEQRLRNGLAIAGSLFITAIGATLFAITYGAPAGPLL